MKKNSPMICLKMLLLLLFTVSISLQASADQKNDSNQALAVKPDLRIQSIQVERIGFAAAGAHQVRVTVRVVNMATAAVCAGPFKVRLEKRDLPAAAYVFLQESGVERLCADPSLARAAMETRSFEDSVPAGTQRVWRASADPARMVDEAREDNNSAESETYVAKTFCSGVDLVLSSVEIVRGTNGNVFMKAEGRNRCTGSCNSQVKFTFDVTDPATGGLGVVQSLAVNINGLQEFATGMVGVYSRSDRSVTYRVRIDPEGGSCADTNPGNNECLVTFTAAETRKTQHCH